MHDVFLDGTTIHVEGIAPDEAAVVAALDRLRDDNGLYRSSRSGHGPARQDGRWPFHAELELVCAVPPAPGGICTPQEPTPP